MRKQDDAGVAWGDEVRFTAPAYVARVVNWTGLDELRRHTRGSAQRPAQTVQRCMRKAFHQAAAGHPCAHRICMAGRIAARRELADKFVRDVLCVDDAWLSDESSLWHFALGGSLDEFYAKIMLFYGVDVRDVSDANIAMILDRIAVDRQTRPDPDLCSLGPCFLVPLSLLTCLPGSPAGDYARSGWLGPCITPPSTHTLPAAAGRYAPAPGQQTAAPSR